jgi:hypothetical protein
MGKGMYYISLKLELDTYRIKNSFCKLSFYLVCEAIGHSWPIVPASGDSEDDCGGADGM